MDDMWTRVGEQLIARVSGPMHFRVYMQPAMAAVFAVISGFKDAKKAKAPYFWTLLNRPGERMEALKDGWHSVGRVFILAIILDAAYQFYVLHFFYVGEAIIVALILAILPYLVLRGIVTRLARRWLGPPGAPAAIPPEARK